MKKLLVGLMLMAVNGNVVLAQGNFYTNVTNLWYQGGESRSNVIAIANARLAVNTNDFAGWFLKAHYHVEFMEIDEMTNAFHRVVQVGNTITTTNFVKRWQGGSKNILVFLKVMAEFPLTPQDIQEGKDMALTPHHQLPNEDLIEALQEDGYFD